MYEMEGNVGRKIRLEFYGAVYHIVNRGNNKKYLFSNYEDKEMLLKIIYETRQESDFELLAYVIMDNHYHLLIRTMNDLISRIMQRINNRYSKYYNIKEKRTGRNFGKRYTDRLVNEERYLLTVVKYIHRNPVKANICDNTFDYEFSSDNAYRINIDERVNIHMILDMFSLDRNKAIKKYIEFMENEEEYIPKEIKVNLKKNFDEKAPIIIKNKTCDQILKEVCISKEIYYLIKNKSKKQYLTKYKLEYIKNAMKLNYSYKEIGANINVSGNAVMNLLFRKEKRWLEQSIEIDKNIGK
jgi:REP element-mobilizing transposase RayT